MRISSRDAPALLKSGAVRRIFVVDVATIGVDLVSDGMECSADDSEENLITLCSMCHASVHQSPNIWEY